jgi:hypothetical protein
VPSSAGGSPSTTSNVKSRPKVVSSVAASSRVSPSTRNWPPLSVIAPASSGTFFNSSPRSTLNPSNDFPITM